MLKSCRLRFVSALAFIVAVSAVHAYTPPPQHTLPADQEARWVAAVKNMKTADGSTVLQALQYAQQLRPTKFKFGDFGIGYSGGDGNQVGASIEYWIGAKRLEGDTFSILFEIREVDGKPVITYPKTPLHGSAAEVVMMGRDNLLGFIDEMYKENCIDPDNGAKLC